MRNLFILLIATLRLAAPAWAMDGDEMRALALALDVDGAETAMQAAHRAALAGHTNQNDLRLAYVALSVSDLRISSFVGRWMVAYPRSPYAMTAQAWQQHQAGLQVRGEGTLRETYPDAIADFVTRHGTAMDFALQAYALAPDLIPASDAVFRLQRTTRRLSDADWWQVVSEVMAVTPTLGSLWRAADATEPQWAAPVWLG